jgi:hypothetical protein
MAVPGNQYPYGFDDDCAASLSRLRPKLRAFGSA